MRKFIILNLVALALAGGALWGLVREARNAGSAEASLERVQAAKAAGGALLALQEELAEESLKLGNFFVTRDSLPVFIEEVEQLALRSKVALKLEGAEERQADLLLKLRAEGSFSALYRFIALLEKMPRALRLETLELSRLETPASPWQGQLTLIISSPPAPIADEK